ncbi:hypothetical protein, partial [Hymenobacter coccineus]|uniref:hypothetical protein n=1 Tax=Hymenobacter coccineus TaxID=1908235 RepID=UPI0013018328
RPWKCPFVKGGFQFTSGVIESEELWLKLSELFFPVYRPWKCPFVKGGFQFTSGVIESEELWLKLSELFF